MKSKLFRLVALLSMLSMLAAPVSAHTSAGATASATEVAVQTPDPDKLSLEPATAVANPGYGRVIADKNATGPATYIVQFTDAPLASYRGGISGLDATNPSALGAVRLDVNSAASQAYLAYLEGQHGQFLNAIGASIGRSVAVKYDYMYAFNGVALELTPDEAANIAALSGVRQVQRDYDRYPLTDAGPQWIGADGIWNGTTTGGLPGTQGEGVVVAVLDTGLNLDHPSFAEVGPIDGYVHTNPLGSGNFLGLCDSDPGTWVCNDKLIGYYIYTGETTEDTDGHGSHTGSTSAGNLVTATLAISVTNPYTYINPISGVAPHANVIGYDVCDDDGGCPNSGSLAATDQTVADMVVDVINFSIGGGTTDPWSDSGTLGFLGAADAGIVPVTSAGNSGPGASTVGSPADAPWMLTVGASTHNRAFVNSLINMTGGDTTPPADLEGVSPGAPYGPAPIVHATDFGDALCAAPFTPGTFSGEIVVCDRGAVARVAKGFNVLQGGAGGMVLANVNPGDSYTSDPHIIPALLLASDDGDLLRAWLASGSGHMATISGATIDTTPSNGDIMAGFSSRGPLVNTAPDIIKPDVTAPGVAILAAYRTGSGPPGDVEPWMSEYSVVSGTSMSSPHTAGAAALMRGLYPNWSASQIKSALMSTGLTSGVVKEDGSTPADPFDLGGGRVDLSMAGEAGFVLEETTLNYENADPGLGGDPKSLNLASLGNAQCLESCSWTRVLSSTQAVSVTWTAAVTGTTGLTLTVTPSNFVLDAFATQMVTVTAEVSGLPQGVWSFGEVSLAPSTAVSDAHFPVAVVPTTGVLPQSIDIETRRDAGSELVEGLQSIAITDLTVDAAGLTQGLVTMDMLDQDPTNDDPYDTITGTFYITTTVPSGAARLVAEVYESSSVDIDLFVGSGTVPSLATELCSSTTASFTEICDLTDPAAGDYWILVQNWLASGSPPDSVSLSSAVVAADAGNLTVTGPASVPAGTPFDLRVFWDDDMTAGDRWYGAISLGSDSSSPGDIGTIPVNLLRVDDDVVKTVDDANPIIGQTLTYTITLAPNISGVDLTYALTDTIPAGLTYVPGSVTASSGVVTVTGSTLTWDGVVAVPSLSYNIETSVTDPTGCVMPLATDGAYVDLEFYGLTTDPSISGDTVAFSVDFDGGEYEFFGANQGEVLNFTDDGFSFFDSSTPGATPWVNEPIPTAGDPDNLMAFFWRDMEIVYDAGLNRGVTLANLTTGGVPTAGIIEYDDIEDWPAGSNDTYDVEMLARYYADPGWYEYIFAYDNLTGNVLTGTIGLENIDGSVGVQYAYDDIAVTDGMAVCFDQVGFGGEEYITYQVTVDTIGTFVNNVESINDNPGAKVESTDVTVVVDAARLQVAHLAPFAMDPGTTVTVTLNGSPALTNFAYTDSTVYLDLIPDTYLVEIFPGGSATPAITGTVDLMGGVDYTAIAIGDGVNQPLSLLALVDDNTAPAAGNFKLRLGHLAPFTDTITGTLADVRLDDGTTVITDVVFGAVAPHLELPAGTYDLKITTPGGGTTLINLAPVTLNDGDILSAFATGDGVNQPLGGYALPSGQLGFVLPLEMHELFLPLAVKN